VEPMRIGGEVMGFAHRKLNGVVATFGVHDDALGRIVVAEFESPRKARVALVKALGGLPMRTGPAPIVVDGRELAVVDSRSIAAAAIHDALDALAGLDVPDQVRIADEVDA